VIGYAPSRLVDVAGVERSGAPLTIDAESPLRKPLKINGSAGKLRAIGFGDVAGDYGERGLVDRERAADNANV